MKRLLRPVYGPVIQIMNDIGQKPDEPGDPFFVVSMPRSGSVFLRTSITQTLGIRAPEVPVTERGYAAYVDADRMASTFAGWRVYGKSHLHAYPENLDALHDAGIRRMCVHMRDPRDVLV